MERHPTVALPPKRTPRLQSNSGPSVNSRQQPVQELDPRTISSAAWSPLVTHGASYWGQ
jgi:hypothetical protein